jgi:hypothetical protein
MRNSAGGVLASPLAIAAPETGGWRDREVVPAPVAYSLHIFDDAVDELPPFHVVFGARRDADGWRLPPLAPRLASTSASLHLGPFLVSAEALVGRDGRRVGVRLTLVDEGRDRRVVAVGVAVYRIG